MGARSRRVVLLKASVEWNMSGLRVDLMLPSFFAGSLASGSGPLAASLKVIEEEYTEAV